MRGDTLGDGEDCTASPFSVITGIGTNYIGTGGGVTGLEGSVCAPQPRGRPTGGGIRAAESE